MFGRFGLQEASTMKDEITAAVLFLSRLICKNEKLNSEQLEQFQTRLAMLLRQRFENHWFPDQPFKGQGYRCIRLNEVDRRDPLLEKAAQLSGLKYEDLQLPTELTVWVDPLEVCCRFGEHRGSYCTVASFKTASSGNFVDVINFNGSECSDQKKKATVEYIMDQLCKDDNGVNGQCAESRLFPSSASTSSSSSYEQMFTKFDACISRQQQQTPTSVRNDRYHWVNKSIVQT